MGRVELGRVEVGRAEVGRAEVGRADVGWAEVDRAEVSRAEVGRAEMGRAEVSRAEVGRAEVGWAEVDRAEVRRAEVGRAEVGRAEVGRAEVGRAEVGRVVVNKDRGGSSGDVEGLVGTSGRTYTLQRQYTENLKQIFPEMRLCVLRPNSYIHVSVSDLYIPTIGLPVLLKICVPVPIEGIYTVYRSQKLDCGNWAAQVLFWEYINRIFFAVYY